MEPEHLDTAFWTSIGLAVFALILLLGLADSVAGFYRQPELDPVLRSLALLPLLSSVSSIQMAVLKRAMDFKTVGLIAMIATGTDALVGIGMGLSGFGIWSPVARYLTNALLAAILLWSVGAWRPRLAFSRRHFKD